MGKRVISYWLLGIGSLFFVFFLLIPNSQFLIPPVHAECPTTDYDCQIAELQREYDSRKEAHEKNKTTLAEYENELASLNKRFSSIEANLKSLEKEIFQREVDLGFQEEVLAARVRRYYINSRKFSPFLLLLSSTSARELALELSFRQQMVSEDQRVIAQTSERILKLQKDKETLKKSKVALASLKEKIGAQAEFMREEVEKTETFFAQIQAKQKDLLALKSGGFSTSVGDVPPADDPASRPDFDPGFRPAYAAFSFGAPHRKGMSQYGAYGRAKLGQSAEQILKAYYGEGINLRRDYPTGITINVQGHGSVDLETYVKRIYEMPASWGDNGGMEALKAQAVAARSYALAYTNNGAGSICATESCQVYKPANKGGKWDEAVDATRGWVLVSNGQPFSSWYASTSGGYTFSYTSQGHTTPGLWDTPTGRGGWTSEAYEKTAGSPWFYKAWYRLRSGASCGRSHPWLSVDEFSDIINALIIYKNDSGAISHLSSLDAGSCLGQNISDTWDHYKVRAEAGKYGGPVSQITDIDLVYSDSGFTQSVSFQTDRGRKEFSGEEFKYIFNLRVPGAIGIKSSLFNMVKK